MGKAWGTHAHTHAHTRTHTRTHAHAHTHTRAHADFDDAFKAREPEQCGPGPLRHRVLDPAEPDAAVLWADAGQFAFAQVGVGWRVRAIGSKKEEETEMKKEEKGKNNN